MRDYGRGSLWDRIKYRISQHPIISTIGIVIIVGIIGASIAVPIFIWSGSNVPVRIEHYNTTVPSLPIQPSPSVQPSPIQKPPTPSVPPVPVPISTSIITKPPDGPNPPIPRHTPSPTPVPSLPVPSPTPVPSLPVPSLPVPSLPVPSPTPVIVPTPGPTEYIDNYDVYTLKSRDNYLDLLFFTDEVDASSVYTPQANWMFEKHDQYYHIKNEYKDKYLYAEQSDVYTGWEAVIKPRNDTSDAQRFEMIKISGSPHLYRVKHVNTGKMMRTYADTRNPGQVVLFVDSYNDHVANWEVEVVS